MDKTYPILEELAREIETMIDRREELAPLIDHIREDNYPRQMLIAELIDAKLKHFASKVQNFYYDNRREVFVKGLNDAQQVSTPTQEN